MKILKFQDRICYLDYLLTLKTSKGQVNIVDRIIEIRLPFNFIDSIPRELTDYYIQINKEHLNSDFYFLIGLLRDGCYYKKKSGNIINYLKNNLEDIKIGLCPEGYKKYPNNVNVTMLSNREEYMPSEDCKNLLLDFYYSISLPYPTSPSVHSEYYEYYNMVNSVINKIK